MYDNQQKVTNYTPYMIKCNSPLHSVFHKHTENLSADVIAWFRRYSVFNFLFFLIFSKYFIICLRYGHGIWDTPWQENCIFQCRQNISHYSSGVSAYIQSDVLVKKWYSTDFYHTNIFLNTPSALSKKQELLAFYCSNSCF